MRFKTTFSLNVADCMLYPRAKREGYVDKKKSIESDRKGRTIKDIRFLKIFQAH